MAVKKCTKQGNIEKVCSQDDSHCYVAATGKASHSILLL